MATDDIDSEKKLCYANQDSMKCHHKIFRFYLFLYYGFKLSYQIRTIWSSKRLILCSTLTILLTYVKQNFNPANI